MTPLELTAPAYHLEIWVFRTSPMHNSSTLHELGPSEQHRTAGVQGKDAPVSA